MQIMRDKLCGLIENCTQMPKDSKSEFSIVLGLSTVHRTECGGL